MLPSVVIVSPEKHNNQWLQFHVLCLAPGGQRGGGGVGGGEVMTEQRDNSCGNTEWSYSSFFHGALRPQKLYSLLEMGKGGDRVPMSSLSARSDP